MSDPIFSKKAEKIAAWIFAVFILVFGVCVLTGFVAMTIAFVQAIGSAQ